MSVNQYGWNQGWIQKWNETDSTYLDKRLVPGRIIGDFGSKFRVLTEDGEKWGEVAGKLRHGLSSSGEYPAIGDWVALAVLDAGDHTIIHQVLPRSSVISRQAAGNARAEQIIAANVDTLFLVSALNDDYNVRRMERYLIMAWNSGATPVILLTKADLCSDPASRIIEMERAAPGVAVHAVSSVHNIGRESLEPYIGSGLTVALTGSSGCGKSTLVNWLCGKTVQQTQEVREGDSRGRHTTTHRELFVMPSGGIIVDTPGMRELQLWTDEGGLSTAFGDLTELAVECRYSNCRHEHEEGCAVLEAVRTGALEEKRLMNYRKTQRELQYQSVKEAKAKRKNSSVPSKAASSSRPRRNSWHLELEEL